MFHLFKTSLVLLSPLLFPFSLDQTNRYGSLSSVLVTRSSNISFGSELLLSDKTEMYQNVYSQDFLSSGIGSIGRGISVIHPPRDPFMDEWRNAQRIPSKGEIFTQNGKSTGPNKPSLFFIPLSLAKTEKYRYFDGGRIVSPVIIRRWISGLSGYEAKKISRLFTLLEFFRIPTGLGDWYLYLPMGEGIESDPFGVHRLRTVSYHPLSSGAIEQITTIHKRNDMDTADEKEKKIYHISLSGAFLLIQKQ